MCDLLTRQITDRIYQLYGTDSGIIFGIPADKKRAIEEIIKSSIELFHKELMFKIKEEMKNKVSEEILTDVLDVIYKIRMKE